MANFDISNLDQSADDYKAGLENLGSADASASGLGAADAQNAIAGALKAFQGFTMMNSGIDLIQDGAAYQAGVYRSSGKAAKQGADFQASVYRQSANAAIVSANYNVALDQLQTDRQQDALGRQLKDVLSSNNAKIASSGIGFGSKSGMMVNSDVMSTVERQFVANKNDSLQRQSLIRYQGALTQAQYLNQAIAAQYSGDIAVQNAENQARSAEYGGDVAAYKAGQQQADQIGGAIQNVFKTFGGV